MVQMNLKIIIDYRHRYLEILNALLLSTEYANGMGVLKIRSNEVKHSTKLDNAV